MRTTIIVYSLMILLLSAHFSRADNNILSVITLLIPFLFFIKQAWVTYVLQIIGYLSALIWFYSAYSYIQIRQAAGEDWLRLLIIIGCVGLYSAWTGYRVGSTRYLNTEKTTE